MYGIRLINSSEKICLKAKMNETETNNNKKYQRLVYGINDFNLRTNIVKNEEGDWVTVSHNAVVMGQYNFSQLFSVHDM
jgi:hypothetical protein